jgi:hypothetical protein
VRPRVVGGYEDHAEVAVVDGESHWLGLLRRWKLSQCASPKITSEQVQSRSVDLARIRRDDHLTL